MGVKESREGGEEKMENGSDRKEQKKEKWLEGKGRVVGRKRKKKRKRDVTVLQFSLPEIFGKLQAVSSPL